MSEERLQKNLAWPTRTGTLQIRDHDGFLCNLNGEIRKTQQERLQKNLGPKSKKWRNVNKKIPERLQKKSGAKSAKSGHGQIFLVIPYCTFRENNKTLCSRFKK